MRKPSFTIESEKVSELKNRLNPITDWSKVNIGQQLFHDTDNNIFNNNIFCEYDLDNNLIKYYNRPTGITYTMSAMGWYVYDESIADEIEDEFTPKLWLINNCLLKVACNQNEIYDTFTKENNYKKSFEEFKEDYTIRLIEEVDDYIINLA